MTAGYWIRDAERERAGKGKRQNRLARVAWRAGTHWLGRWLIREICRGDSGAGQVGGDGGPALTHSLTGWVAGSLGKSAVVTAERDSDGGPALTHWLGRWLTREICRGES